MTDIQKIIYTKNLTAGYNGQTVWRNANLEVNAGEFIGLLGPNGAGKSTLLKVLLGLVKPLSGEVKVFNETPKRGNGQIGYVPQRWSIDNDSRIEAIEFVRLNIESHRFGFSLPRQASKERQIAMAALKQVGAEGLAEKSLGELSGGEAQRVFIAQALVSQPKLMLLDEPLASLDIRHGMQILRLIQRIAKTQHIAIVLIAHDINPLLPVADRIIYIANKRVASGKLSEVITSETLSKLYNSPVEVMRDSKGQVAVLGTEEAMHHDI